MDSKKEVKLFCDFRRQALGLCMKYTGGGKCKLHIGKTEKKNIYRQKRFRGDSVYQKNIGMFKSKEE